jgi:hypothetical protein
MKNIEIKIYKTIFFLFCTCVKFGAERKGTLEKAGENCIIMSFTINALYPILLR